MDRAHRIFSAATQDERICCERVMLRANSNEMIPEGATSFTRDSSNTLIADKEIADITKLPNHSRF